MVGSGYVVVNVGLSVSLQKIAVAITALACVMPPKSGVKTVPNDFASAIPWRRERIA